MGKRQNAGVPGLLECFPQYLHKLTHDFNPLPHNAAFLRIKDIISVENIVRKGEIACNNQFLLSSKCFLPYTALIFHFKCTLKCRLQFI